MDCFCWNIRGFNNSVKRRWFRKWLKLHQPLFGSLSETHVCPEKAQYIINRVFPGWSFDCNYEFSDLGKIWIVWHPSVSVKVISKSLQSINCLIKLPYVQMEFAVSFVYGLTCKKLRRELWSELLFLAVSPEISCHPWAVLGDFNQILYASEHSNADHFSSSRGMRDFSSCITSSGLSDLPFCGASFTWSNKHEVGVVAKKLDRILVNDQWLDSFPNSLGVFGEPGISDHSPCCIFLDSMKPKIKQPFKFLAFLNLNPEFAILIESCWNALEFAGSKMLKVSKKLKEMKSFIRHFSKENYSGIERRVAEAYAHLLSCQQSLLQAPSPLTVLAEKEAHAKWSTLAKAEDSFLLQRSRVKWIGEGDANTTFFHQSIKSRQSQNIFISSLMKLAKF